MHIIKIMLSFLFSLFFSDCLSSHYISWTLSLCTLLPLCAIPTVHCFLLFPFLHNISHHFISYIISTLSTSFTAHFVIATHVLIMSVSLHSFLCSFLHHSFLFLMFIEFKIPFPHPFSPSYIIISIKHQQNFPTLFLMYITRHFFIYTQILIYSYYPTLHNISHLLRLLNILPLCLPTMHYLT